MQKEADYQSKTIEETLNLLDSTKKGLSQKQAVKRLRKYGLNVLPEKEKHPLFWAFIKQFKSLFVYILTLAAVISYFSGSLIDTYVIVGIIILNATIGFVQEQKAEKAIKALKKMVVSKAKVLRQNTVIQISSREVVPGDIIILESGDKVPADAKLLEIKNFTTNEASLTGESLPIVKDLKILDKKTTIADQKNMVFFGTFVTSGKAIAIITATGKDTEIGKLAASLEKVKRTPSHFERKTNKLALQMGVFALIGAALTFSVGYFYRGFEFNKIFLFTIASLVSGIPEGLPAVLSIVLAIGAFRMAKRQAIMRHLPSTETLAVVDTIITDKTGTLTENTMTIQEIILPGQENIKVTGEGWEPKGEFSQDNKIINPETNNSLQKLLSISSICHNTDISYDKKDKMYKIIGEPTEASLLVLSKKANLKEIHKKIDDMPFDQNLKFRASLAKTKTIKELYLAGAPEAIIDKCSYQLKKGKKSPFTQYDKNKLERQIQSLTRKALRVIALVAKNTDSIDDLEDNFTFIGIVGMKDPPRKEVKSSIARARTAGIRIIMLTGDHKETAVAVAKEIGLIPLDNPQALTGTELEKMSSSNFNKAIRKIDVFARLTPEMKLKIATTLQQQGRTIAMTGDGVNDAPALKKSDIGISMGKIGTDVARESSEMVLSDDNFASIVSAIEEGRVVFNNVKRTSFFLITTNIAEDATIITALLFKLPLPLLPTQILWLNLVTDTASGIGLANEPAHQHIYNDKPKSKNQSIIDKEIIPFLLIMVGVMAILTYFVFSHFLPQGLDKARTAAFVIMSFTQLYNSINLRSLKRSITKLKFFENKTLLIALSLSIIAQIIVLYVPFFQDIFQFAHLAVLELLALIAISSLALIVGEIYKRIRYGDIE